MKIKLTTFQGIVPIIEPRLLDGIQAQTAENVDLLRGVLSAIKEPGTVTTLPDSSRISIFPYNNGWLSWATDVDVVRGPINEDQYNRIYYTGDGVPKVRGTVSGTEYEYALGIPKPLNAPTCAAQAKTETTWTRTWHYQYEASDGSVTQSGDLTEGSYGGETVEEVTPGVEYRIETIPAKTTAGASDRFVAYFDAYSSSGSYLGRMYPSPSAYENNTDYYLDGAQVTGTQTTAVSSPQWSLTLTYDTSRASDYEIDRYYAYTFVSEWGEEGPLCLASSVVAIDPTEDCNITGLDTGFSAYSNAATYKLANVVTHNGHYYLANQDIDTAEEFDSTHWDDLGTSNPYNITKKRLYRTVTGDAGTFYRLVAELDLSTATYLDQLTDT